MLRILAACFCALILLTGTSEARQRHHVTVADDGCNGTYPNAPVCIGVAPSARGLKIEKAMPFGTAQKVYKRVAVADWRSGIRQKPVRRAKPVQTETASYGAPTPSVAYTVGKVAAQIVGHPSGCPGRAFCGCGAAVRVFGSPIRSLWLAANWFKFPRSAPAAGMVAVRQHHVFVLEAHLGGDIWQVYDANSGGHATRIHARSINGYVIVNPRGAA